MAEIALEQGSAAARMEAALKPLTGPALILAAFVLALSNFMAILDQTLSLIHI